VHFNQAVHHFAFAVPNRRHIDRSRSGRTPEFAGMVDEIRNFGAPDLILAGETIDVRARSANPPPLNDRGLSARSRRMPGEDFPALAATDNDVPIVFCTHVNTLSKQAFARSS
jgi:hypothetical protein